MLEIIRTTLEVFQTQRMVGKRAEYKYSDIAFRQKWPYVVCTNDCQGSYCKTEVATMLQRPWDEIGVVEICVHPRIVNKYLVCAKYDPQTSCDFENGVLEI
jgi:hypothetical protein